MATPTSKAVSNLAEQAFQFIFQASNLSAGKFDEIANDVNALVLNIRQEVQRIRDFEINIHWKTRVINVPSAIAAFHDLFVELTDGLTEKFSEIAVPFTDFKNELALFRNIPLDPGVSRITSSLAQVQNFVDALNRMVGEVDQAIKDASDLTELFDRILNDIETLDDLFLPQGNSRRRIGTDLGPISIRVGKLHRSEL